MTYAINCGGTQAGDATKQNAVGYRHTNGQVVGMAGSQAVSPPAQPGLPLEEFWGGIQVTLRDCGGIQVTSTQTPGMDFRVGFLKNKGGTHISDRSDRSDRS